MLCSSGVVLTHPCYSPSGDLDEPSTSMLAKKQDDNDKNCSSVSRWTRSACQVVAQRPQHQRPHHRSFRLGSTHAVGVYFQCARLNHSCLPNSVRAVGDDNNMTVVSTRGIQKGEITISYLDDSILATDWRCSVRKTSTWWCRNVC